MDVSIGARLAMLLAAFSLSQADRAAVQAMASMALWCIQSPLNLLEEGFAGRRKICNQLLQGIDEKEITHDLVDQGGAATRREATSPPPVSLDLSTSKSDRYQDFIQIPRIGCVFTQQERSAFDRLLIRPSEPKGSQGAAMVQPFQSG